MIDAGRTGGHRLSRRRFRQQRRPREQQRVGQRAQRLRAGGGSGAGRKGGRLAGRPRRRTSVTRRRKAAGSRCECAAMQLCCHTSHRQDVQAAQAVSMYKLCTVCTVEQRPCGRQKTSAHARSSSWISAFAARRQTLPIAVLQAEVHARADGPGTAFWRLTDGRGSPDDKTAAGRVDFVVQVRCDVCCAVPASFRRKPDAFQHLHLRGILCNTSHDLPFPTEYLYLSAVASHFSIWTLLTWRFC